MALSSEYCRSARHVLPALAVVAFLLPMTPAHANETDPWFGRDKALHFTVTAALGAGGYALTNAGTDVDWPPWVVGAGVAMGAGIGKELWDLSGRGDPSWRDLTWDVMGTATGLLTAWLFDRWLTKPPSPPSVSPALFHGACRVCSVDQSRE